MVDAGRPALAARCWRATWRIRVRAQRRRSARAARGERPWSSCSGTGRCCRSCARTAVSRITVLISEHRDGEIIARILARLRLSDRARFVVARWGTRAARAGARAARTATRSRSRRMVRAGRAARAGAGRAADRTARRRADHPAAGDVDARLAAPELGRASRSRSRSRASRVLVRRAARACGGHGARRRRAGEEFRASMADALARVQALHAGAVTRHEDARRRICGCADWAGTTRGVARRPCRRRSRRTRCSVRSSRVRNAPFDSRLRCVACHGACRRSASGNLTVGGTGKTPVAAWCARRAPRGGRARPAIVLRGYGDDEPRVHALLNPGHARGHRIADRVAACATRAGTRRRRRRARRCLPASSRRARRWTSCSSRPTGGDAAVRLLPAGPWREPLSSLRRASLGGGDTQVDGAPMPRTRRGGDWRARRIACRRSPSVPRASRSRSCLAAAAPGSADELGAIASPSRAAAGGAPRGDACWPSAAIGDPGAFEAQLRATGAAGATPARFPTITRSRRPMCDAIVRRAGGRASSSSARSRTR